MTSEGCPDAGCEFSGQMTLPFGEPLANAATLSVPALPVARRPYSRLTGEGRALGNAWCAVAVE